MKIKRILISQPPPESENSPYNDIEKLYTVEFDFKKFIKIAPVTIKEYRKQRIRFNDYDSIILTSKNAVDNFFRICEETRQKMPEVTKYYCPTEQIACYISKYVNYKKRRVFYNEKTGKDIYDIIKKNKAEKYLFPCSDVHNNEIPNLLNSWGIRCSKVVLYKTKDADMSDIDITKYYMLVFFSPYGIRSLKNNFPEFQQNDTLIAAFGKQTQQAITDAGLTLNLNVPNEKAQSMHKAIEYFLSTIPNMKRKK